MHSEAAAAASMAPEGENCRASNKKTNLLSKNAVYGFCEIEKCEGGLGGEDERPQTRIESTQKEQASQQQQNAKTPSSRSSREKAGIQGRRTVTSS